VVTRQENGNSKQYLETIIKTIHENLRMIEHAPRYKKKLIYMFVKSINLSNLIIFSVMMQDVPPDLLNFDESEELDPDEYYDGEKDQDRDGAEEKT